MLWTLLTGLAWSRCLILWCRMDRQIGCSREDFFLVGDVGGDSFCLCSERGTRRWGNCWFECRGSFIIQYIKISTIVFVVIGEDRSSNVFSTVRTLFRLVTTHMQVFLHGSGRWNEFRAEGTANGLFWHVVLLEWRQLVMRVQNESKGKGQHCFGYIRRSGGVTVTNVLSRKGGNQHASRDYEGGGKISRRVSIRLPTACTVYIQI